MLERIARAVFAAMEQQAALHPLTDFDSEWANRRGDYLGVPVPSRVDRAMEVARAAVEAMREPSPAVMDVSTMSISYDNREIMNKFVDAITKETA